MSIERADAAVKREGQVISGSRNMSFSQIYRKYGTVLIFVGICILASILSPTFLTEANLTNVLRQVVVVSLLACGVTFIIILGHIDVSLGSVLALCGVIAASVMAITGSVILAVVAGVAVGMVTGIINGFVITFFRIPSFIMTLAMTTVARGAVLLYTGGSPVTGLGEFRVIGQGSLGPVPISVLILAIVVVISWILLNKTKFGRYVYAVGGNERAARASGINPDSIIVKAFIFNGILCAVAGIVLMSRINSGQPAGGVGYEFDAITAVVVGGTSLMGGTGTITGTIIGSMIIGVINNMLNLMNVSSYWQQIIKGLIIAIAVILDVWTKSARSKKKA
ncbi:ribose ABC transporter permease protein (plasmid) [Rhizobium phaseoli]|uniref:ABC transporter permease n=1 Tax=Rhizobium phaseoli TaxID=396 RepID=UPI0007EA69B1|nr:ABC transporter permease [Rhizobium phaseoli]ANL69888.1 ribose ABC transporter permease protein [Rhizobium phaseoli]ANL76324.1 ribose ABC transporter permease protein [Rhizobium phaseoli]ANL82680.1 ribose ABC transporter permease protein [Rhizobium phaseoli]PDS69818.1 ABC transporter permease [Rhizobium phaseoli]